MILRLTTLGFFVLIHLNALSQSAFGYIFDKQSKKPLSSANVYFNNTTIGGLTNRKGFFKINNPQNNNTPLVINYLGYKTKIIHNYKQVPLKIYLEKDVNELNEVEVFTNDPFTREQKLAMFKRSFLGNNKYAKYCKILNEEELVLRYYKGMDEGELQVYSKNPIIITNKYLGYTINYNLIDFSEIRKGFSRETIFYGTVFYKEMFPNKKKYHKHRKKVYQGSILHFIKSLYQNQLDENNFHVIANGMVANNTNFFDIKKRGNITEVSLKKDTIHFIHNISKKKYKQSILMLKASPFTIDKNLNYDPRTILFGGFLGKEKISLMLPLDYSNN